MLLNRLMQVPCLLFVISLLAPARGQDDQEQQQEIRRLLYVASPGVRNYLEFGGHGVLVYDIDRQHSFGD